MSKTVKRVMTVMMMGLIAMLGVVKAEAHYIVVKGRCIFHSLECGREDEEVPDPTPVPNPSLVSLPLSEVVAQPSLPLSEVVAKPDRVEILCADGRVRFISLPDESVTLTAEKKAIAPSDFTEVKNLDSKVIDRNLQFQGIVSDTHFLDDPTICPRSTPEEVIIRRTSVEINLYCSPETDRECSTKADQPHSSWIARRCTLPFRFTFFFNRPTRGAPYDCSGISTCHGDECLKP
ncbi:MAG: hypothetical protein ACT4QB_10480 [Gammaproteobacteria bacterium]